MDGSSDDQIYVGQKCQDATEGSGKEEVSQRDLLEETSFTESELKEKKEGCRNPFSNVPFPSMKNKEHTKVGSTDRYECTQTNALSLSDHDRRQRENAFG